VCPPRFPVRRALIYTHRWLGIAGSLLFAAWFVSGIVMIYKRMPALSPEERLTRSPELDLSTVEVSPLEASRRAGIQPDRLRIGMLEGRPVYRLVRGRAWSTVFADDGKELSAFDSVRALGVARRFAPEQAGHARLEERLTKADQWTLQLRNLLPMQRIALDDVHGTRLYVSEITGEVVMKTTRSQTRWAYVGAVLHWLYFTPFREHTGLWINSVIWLSIAGCVLALSGIVWGVWRFSLQARYRIKGVHSRSPYAGLMRWHHYAGLIFGLTTFTWILSGCLSLDPWSWHPGASPSSEATEAFAGGPLRLDLVTAEKLRSGTDTMRSSFPLREVEVLQFDEEPYLLAYRATAPKPTPRRTGPASFLSAVQPLEYQIISVVTPGDGPLSSFSEDRLLRAASEAMPGMSVSGTAWLDEYDDYYYSREGSLPLPVLRVEYDDPGETWLYLEPGRGLILRKEERLTRLNRWLFHGLHSFDFRFLYYRRPLWDAVVIALSLGGLVLCLSSIRQAWNRLRRHVRRL